MKISLLQPHIKRGDIAYNLGRIQSLVEQSHGQLLALPEYALTGSLVLDAQADVRQWARLSADAKARLNIPQGKYVLLNSLTVKGGILYNLCELLPTAEVQAKVFLDPLESQAGIAPGESHRLFELEGKRFKVLICADFRHEESIPVDGADFFVWITHFSEPNYPRSLEGMSRFVQRTQIPLLAVSLVSDQNIGCSTYMDAQHTINLSQQEGILEIDWH